MKYRLLTVFWGHSFADLFVRLCARSLLAPGNFADLSRSYPTTWTIYTTPDCGDFVNQHPVIHALHAAGHVEFNYFQPDEINSENPSSHWTIWKRGIMRAIEDGEFVIYIMPDMVYAAGTLAEWARTFEKGYRAIFSPAPQVVLETFVEDVEKAHSPTNSPEMSIDVPTLTGLGLKHLHPYHLCMLRDSPRWVRHPETVGYIVPDEGYVLRIVGSHQLCFDPTYFEYNHSYTPLNQLDRIAFSPCTAVSAEPFLKFMSLYYRPWAMTPDRLSNLGWWLDLFTTPANDVESTFSYVLPASTHVDFRKFSRAHAAGNFYRAQYLAVRSIYRIWHKLNEIGCSKAAALLAAAHYVSRLRRHTLLPGPVTILVPTDQALESAKQIFANNLHVDALRKLIRGHAFRGKFDLRATSPIYVAFGEEPAITAREPSAQCAIVAKGTVLEGPHEIDDFTIYVVDFVIDANTAGFQNFNKLTMAGRNRKDRSISSRDTSPVPATAHKLIVHPAFQEPLSTTRDSAASASIGNLNSDKKPELRIRDNESGHRDVAAIGALRAKVHNYLGLPRETDCSIEANKTAMPILGNHFGHPWAFHKIYIVRKLSKAKAAVARVPVIGPLAATFFRACRLGLRHLRSLRYILLPLKSLVVSSTSAPSAPALSPSVASSAGNMVLTNRLFQFARLQIGLSALHSLLADYFSKLPVPRHLRQPPTPSPLEYLDEFVSQQSISLDPLPTLADVLKQDPEFAEAWVEKGWLAWESGNLLDATDAALAALRAQARLGTGSDYPHPYIEAASLIAECLARAGLAEEAILAYQKLFSLNDNQPVQQIACGRLLWQLGRIEQAIVCFNRGMSFGILQANLPRLPRHIRDLTQYCTNTNMPQGA